jgi:hypothetical protein
MGISAGAKSIQVAAYFKADCDHAVFRPCGHVTLAQVAEMVEESIELAKARRVRRLLDVITGLDGFPSPTLTERFQIVEGWAGASAGRIKFALVIEPWLINPERFGVMVARNRGFDAEVFTSGCGGFHFGGRGPCMAARSRGRHLVANG